MFFQCFWVTAFQLRGKIDKERPQTDEKWSKNVVSILISFLLDFGTNLGWFWEGFGGQVGTKLAPNRIRTRPHNQSRKLSLFGRPPKRFLINFRWIWGPSWGDQGGTTNLFFWHFWDKNFDCQQKKLQLWKITFKMFQQFCTVTLKGMLRQGLAETGNSIDRIEKLAGNALVITGKMGMPWLDLAFWGKSWL